MRPQYVLAGVGAAFAIPLSLFVVSTISATPTVSAVFAPVGDVRPTSTPAPALTQAATPAVSPRPSVTPLASQTPAHVATVTPESEAAAVPIAEKPRIQVRQKAANSPQNGWNAPSLVRGVNDIATPLMTSGERATSMVACIPSTACTVSGTSLTIGADATSVTVRWTAPGRATWKAWSITKTLE